MPRRTTPAKQEESGGLPTWVIATGIGVIVVIAAVVLFMIQTPQAPAPLTTGPSTTAVNGRTKGSPEAKVELVDWSDFQ